MVVKLSKRGSCIRWSSVAINLVFFSSCIAAYIGFAVSDEYWDIKTELSIGNSMMILTSIMGTVESGLARPFYLKIYMADNSLNLVCHSWFTVHVLERFQNGPIDVQINMITQMVQYTNESNPDAAEYWDRLQQDKRCCGVENHTDWWDFHVLENGVIPKSCCNEERRKNDTCKEYYPKQCYDYDQIKLERLIIRLHVVAQLVLIVSGISMAAVLIHHIPKTSKEPTLSKTIGRLNRI